MLSKNTYGGIELYRSVYRFVNSNMYAIIINRSAIIIDPHKSDELTDLLVRTGVDDVWVLLTHEHHDHTSGLFWYQEQFNARFFVQKEGAEWMASEWYLRPMFLTFLLSEADKVNGTDVLSEFKKDFVPKKYWADGIYENSLDWNLEGHCFTFYHIPGHSKGSSLIIMDEKLAFTGDTLFLDVPTSLRFPGGSKNDFLEITVPLLNRKLKKDMVILPGHGRPFALGEKMKDGQIDIQFK